MSPVDPTRVASLIEDLRKVSAFADQPQPDLEWFVSQSEERRVAPGEITVREDTPADKMFVLLEGEIRARRENGPADGPVFTGKAGSVAGVLPFSRMKSFTVTGRAVSPARILDFPSKSFPELFQRMPELSARLVGLLTDRVRDFTRTEQQHEKLAALGKLSAGLAHELNNPAAAARRSAGALRDCLQRLRDAGRTSTLGPEDCGLLAQREEEIRAMLKPPEFKDEFARVEREEAIQAWLEAHKVADAWKLAPLLADANFADAKVLPQPRALRSARNSPDLRPFSKWGASRMNSKTARRASPNSSRPLRNIPTWTRRRSRKWTSSTAWKPLSQS